MPCFLRQNDSSFGRFLLALFVLTMASGATSHAESPSWWPRFGGEDEAAATANDSPPAESADSMIDAPLFNIGWPKITMPKFAWKGSGEQGATTPASNPVSDTLDRVANASRSASEKVRGAWGSAVSKLKPAPSTQVAQQEQEGGWWSRLMRPEPEPQGPRTTTEFLAQERIGVTR